MEEKTQKIDFVTRRRQICNSCEHQGIYFKKVKACKKCGCAILGKTMLKWASCPIGKWDAEKD
jgi:hypothetical protein